METSTMTPSTISVAGLVLYSPAPQGLATFYERALGFNLDATSHGNMGQHFEGLLNGVHIAIWDSNKGHASATLVPTFRVRSIRATEPNLLAAGATMAHRTIELGAGKRVAGYLDPDQRHFRLIEID
jgi:catechol 2,3-dioxygenase-like lactoylglutathione lyase family enzyme